MKLLLKNAQIVNVFTDQLEAANVLIDDEKIAGVGQYSDEDADTVRDLSGKILCPGFIDGHIHIESSMLTAREGCQLLAEACRAEPVQVIGSRFVLYRRNDQKPCITLPAAGKPAE